jgi:hypothetical protein
MYYRGTRVGALDASGVTMAGVIDMANFRIINVGVAGTDFAADGGLTLAKALTVTSGDVGLTSGNFRAGAATAFATTQPISAAVFKTGTAPAGTIATSAGVFSDGTSMRKIIADGTVSNVET